MVEKILRILASLVNVSFERKVHDDLRSYFFDDRMILLKQSDEGLPLDIIFNTLRHFTVKRVGYHACESRQARYSSHQMGVGLKNNFSDVYRTVWNDLREVVDEEPEFRFKFKPAKCNYFSLVP